MNEFTEQFVIESRELVEQAAAALSILEREPNHAEKIDELFRAFHTLKGGSSIVEFAEMERALHATEEALTSVKQNGSISTVLIAASHVCLDQVTRWLDRMEQSGEIPADAHAEAEAVMTRIGGSQDQGADKQPIHRVSRELWVDELLGRSKNIAQQVRCAVRFTPHPDSFLRGEDPLALVAALPGVLALDIKPVDTWPPLASLDPFQSLLAIDALMSSPVGDVRTLLSAHADECEIVELAIGRRQENDSLPGIARSILDAQIALLDEPGAEGFAGRVGSAGRAAANVFRRLGRAAVADLIDQAATKSLSEQNALRLKTQIVDASIATPPDAPPGQTEASRPDTSAKTLRVNAARIDDLVRLVGELLVVKNALGHAAKQATAEDNTLATRLKNNYGELGHITAELQRAVLGMRVLPLRTVLQRFAPVVREMSSNFGKPSRLVIEGGDTEADKAIVDMLFEPLLHIVRNSMDHGIESPATRAERKKPAIATITMRAVRTGEHVVIEVEDDGAGIDVDRVRAVAIARGISTTAIIAGMSHEEIVELIFAPGFSTATKVTEISGRGVGMDAVRSAVARIGGTVSIVNSFGAGTLVRFTLPYSVLMTHVMTVESGDQMFGIPLEAIVETISVPVESISAVGSARAIVRRNRTIPVFDLAALLRERQGNGNKSHAVIVVASFGGQFGGIEVDRLGERMEVMLKPLDGMLSGIPGIAGTTILGDGRVLLVLDLEGVLQ